MGRTGLWVDLMVRMLMFLSLINFSWEAHTIFGVGTTGMPGASIAGEPMGGNSYSYAGLEYTFKIADPLRFAFFYDGGYLRTGDFKLLPGDGQEDGMTTGVWDFESWSWECHYDSDLGFPISDP